MDETTNPSPNSSPAAGPAGPPPPPAGRPAAPPAPSSAPIRNLRVTFWGVQGSCPIFPTGREVNEYARRIATYTIERAVTDLAEKDPRGGVTPETLRRLAAPETAAHYQAELGLPDLPVYGGGTTCIEVENGEGAIPGFCMGSGA